MHRRGKREDHILWCHIRLALLGELLCEYSKATAQDSITERASAAKRGEYGQLPGNLVDVIGSGPALHEKVALRMQRSKHRAIRRHRK